jgi:hypothetical protein
MNMAASAALLQAIWHNYRNLGQALQGPGKQGGGSRHGLDEPEKCTLESMKSAR